MTWVVVITAAVIICTSTSADSKLDGQASKTRLKRESSISFLYRDLTNMNKMDHNKRFAIFREDRYPQFEGLDNDKYKIFNKMVKLQNLRLRERVNDQDLHFHGDDVGYQGSGVGYQGDSDHVDKRQGRWDMDYGLGSGRFGKRSDVIDYDVEYAL